MTHICRYSITLNSGLDEEKIKNYQRDYERAFKALLYLAKLATVSEDGRTEGFSEDIPPAEETILQSRLGSERGCIYVTDRRIGFKKFDVISFASGEYITFSAEEHSTDGKPANKINVNFGEIMLGEVALAAAFYFIHRHFLSAYAQVRVDVKFPWEAKREYQLACFVINNFCQDSMAALVTDFDALSPDREKEIFDDVPDDEEKRRFFESGRFFEYEYEREQDQKNRDEDKAALIQAATMLKTPSAAGAAASAASAAAGAAGVIEDIAATAPAAAGTSLAVADPDPKRGTKRSAPDPDPATVMQGAIDTAAAASGAGGQAAAAAAASTVSGRGRKRGPTPMRAAEIDSAPAAAAAGTEATHVQAPDSKKSRGEENDTSAPAAAGAGN